MMVGCLNTWRMYGSFNLVLRITVVLSTVGSVYYVLYVCVCMYVCVCVCVCLCVCVFVFVCMSV